jgi:hypothetical protein
VCGDANFFRADTPTLLISTKAEKPTTGCNSESVKDRGLAGGVVTDEQIEPWIEFERTVLKAVEVLDRELFNPH